MLARRDNVVQDTLGDAYITASIVVTAQDGTAVTIYSDASGTTRSSTIAVDAVTGEYAYYAVPGRYKEVVQVGGVTVKTLSDVLISEPVPVTTTDATAAHTLSVVDGYLRMTNAGANTVTVPPNSSVPFPLNAEVFGCQAGAGQTTLTAGAGVTLNATPGLKTRAQFSPWGMKQVAANVWDVWGDLSA